jgi:LysM domain
MESSTTNVPGRAGLGRWVARFLAVLAVAAAAVALFLVIFGSLDSSDDDAGRSGKREQQQQQQTQTQTSAETYVVQPGDSLGAIAAETGVSVERLEELNPQVDPQALQAGASLKLR